MARFSTGLRNALAVSYGLGAMMNGGVIRVYGGSRPVTPDDPPGTTELGRITTDGLVFIPGNDTVGAGLLLGFSPPGSLINNGVWRLKGLSIGTATWWRWNWASADSMIYSTTLPRVDGLIGTELVLATTAITAATNVEIEQFVFTLGMGS